MMKEKLKEFLAQAGLTKGQGISMQRKLMLYWLSVILANFSALLLFLSIAGIFPNDRQSFGREMTVRMNNTYDGAEEYFNTLTAQGLQMSEISEREIGNELSAAGYRLEELNDHPDRILKMENALYYPVDTSLRVSNCSGAFIVLNTTTNTEASSSHFSRSGLYLRFANVTVGRNLNQFTTFFRGIPDIARNKNLQMHNRWNLEFDEADMPYFRSVVPQKITRTADSCYLTERLHLKDTWEDAVLLCIPIAGEDHLSCGICGMEISSLYFRLAHPVRDSQFGPVVTVLAPLDEENRLYVSKGLAGGTDGTYLNGNEIFTVNEGKYYNTYSFSSGSYVGLHRVLPVTDRSGAKWAVAELVPKESYDAAANRNNRRWALVFFVLLVLLFLLSHFLSGKFVGPISKSLLAIQTEKPLEGNRTGITEIDSLIAFIQSRENNQKIEKSSMPPDIVALFDAFSKRAQSLTAAERGILKYYVDGHEISEIPELACISMSTVRKHNRSIYEKLEVSSKDELMLYIDLFRKCDRLDELI